jgi:hypothetical protein
MDNEGRSVHCQRGRLIESPSMPELLPIDPRSAEELTPGELQDVDENMFNPTAGNRINLRERCNVDFNPRQQVVDFGAQAKSDYCRNRHAVDDFQLHAPPSLQAAAGRTSVSTQRTSRAWADISRSRPSILFAHLRIFIFKRKLL